MSKSELEQLNELAKDGLDFMKASGEDVDRLDQEMHDLIEDKVHNSATKKSNTFKILAVLFSVLVLSIFAYLILKPAMPHSKLVAQYYTTPPFMESKVERSGVSQTASLSHISNLYNTADFSEVSKLLNETVSGPMVFYKGISQFESGEVQDAIVSFKAAMNTEYKDLAQWYLSLSLITTNQNDAAKIMLQEITKSSQHYKHVQAKELLQFVTEAIGNDAFVK